MSFTLMLPESESGGDFSLDLVTDGFNLCKQIGDTLKLRGKLFTASCPEKSYSIALPHWAIFFVHDFSALEESN